MDMLLFYVIAGIVFVFSLGVRQKLRATYDKWSRVRSATGRPGGQVARVILDSNRLQAVPVDPVHGKLADHYDPTKKRIRLARDNFYGNSVAATAVSAHECGHAIQDATGYGPMKLRTAAIPVANAGARFGLPLAIVGGFLGSSAMVQIGVLAYAGAILITFLTLPVEFNASKRALEQLDSLNLVSEDGHDAAKQVLKSAAMTYVAGVASSAGYIVYLVIVGGRALLGRPKLPPGPPIPPLR
jgi:Zn-dependent membrane protease YugP